MIKNGFTIVDIEQKADEIGTEIEALKSHLKLHEQQAKPLRQDEQKYLAQTLT